MLGQIPPRRVALSGGAMKGLAHFGALGVLQEAGMLRCVREYCGTSAGALVAFCICIGYTIQELQTLCALFPFDMLQNLEPDSILQFTEQFAFDNRENLDKALVALLRVKGLPESSTFRDLAARPEAPQLRVFAVDVCSCLRMEFSARLTPDVEVRRAVAASMAIPFYYSPVRMEEMGALLVDGGLLAHFPFIHMSREEREETIGITFTAKRHPTELAAVDGIGPFLMQLYHSAYYLQHETAVSEWTDRVIEIDCGAFPSMNFAASPEEKRVLMEAGAAAARTFLKKSVDPRPSPARRYSVS